MTYIWNPKERIEKQVHYPLTVLTMTIYRPLVLYMVVLELRVVRIIRIMESGEWTQTPSLGEVSML